VMHDIVIGLFINKYEFSFQSSWTLQQMWHTTTLRTTYDHYRLIEIAAQKTGKSINAWMDEVLTQEAKQIININ
jgi:uncharacterized protein (DUF1778 family)